VSAFERLPSVASIGAAKGALLIGGLRIGSGQSDVVGLLVARHRKRRRL
jgi:hypothetical protein